MLLSHWIALFLSLFLELVIISVPFLFIPSNLYVIWKLILIKASA